MFVSEIMSTRVAECTEDSKLEDVFELIQKAEHGLVVVVDSLAHRVPIGVVTERSICEQVISRGKNPRTLSAVSVMDSRIKQVPQTELVENIADANHADAAAIVAIDDNRQVCGLVLKEKLKRAASAPLVSESCKPVFSARTSLPQTRANRISEIPAFGWMS